MKTSERNIPCSNVLLISHCSAPTPIPGTPKAGTPPLSPLLAPQGPSQLLTALLAKLPDATNRSLIDQAAVDFAFLNSKAARKRLVKFMTQVPRNRVDLLPHYSRLIGILNPYMPDIGTELVAAVSALPFHPYNSTLTMTAQLDDEFRYLQKKKNVVKEFTETRMKVTSAMHCCSMKTDFETSARTSPSYRT